jgi:threonine/homoserine/homoserine lactone efflux protein
MEAAIFIKGLVVGLIICAPVGPIGVLCVRRTLTEGRLAGFFSVLGASTADAVYCAIAGLGITYVSSFLAQEKVLLQLLGGAVLILVGAKIFFSKMREGPAACPDRSLFQAYYSAFLIMLANPFPILIFGAVLTALGVHGWKGDYVSTGILVVGVLAGSALWAPVLVALVTIFNLRFSGRELIAINRIAGAMIFSFGAFLSLATLLGLANHY